MLKDKWKAFREWDNKGFLIHRVDGDKAYTKRGFIFDRRIFRVYLILVFVCIVAIMYTSNVGIKELYINCPEGAPACDNPCYDNDDSICAPYSEIKQLLPGESFGTPPSQEYLNKIKGLVFVIVSGFVVAFSVNKLLWNRGRKLNTIFNDGDL